MSYESELNKKWNKKMIFSIVSELVDYGFTEDGEAYIGEAYFIRAEDEDGSRFAHVATFHGAVRSEYGFNDVRDEAKKKAEKLLVRIEAGKADFSGDFWVEVEPRYGSEAYSNNY